MASPETVSQDSRLEKKFGFFKELTRIVFSDIKKELISDSIIDKLFIKKQILLANDTIHKQEPESFTKEKIIERLLQFLGYDVSALRHEIVLKVRDEEKRDADYKLLVRTQFILLEAEPVNKDLELKGSGANQVREWLGSRFSETDYGIATDGLRWKLLRVSQATKTIPVICEIDLSPFFVRHLLQDARSDHELKQLFDQFYFYFSSDTILDAFAGATADTLRKESIVTDLFYRKYMKYVFGVERGTKLTNCLMNKITNSNTISTLQDKSLFSVVTMNRLIFVKFLQDKTIIPRAFLYDLIEEYKKSPNNPISFYQTYLKPLFYDIFSKPPHSRRSLKGSNLFADIPYLNGGLFMESVPFEKEFDIEDDIIFEIIGNDFLAGFNLTYTIEGDTDRINPDILGRVFEKTINFITSKPEVNKKEQGAYYTPTEITNYLCENTIKRFLFAKSICRLEELGHPKEKLNSLRDYDDLLRALPDDLHILEELHNIVSPIKILDPACGSGHFLKDAGDILLRINRVFFSKRKQQYSEYYIQKMIIVQNLYGVDIDANAVEIAKLRLWMSLIDSADEDEKLESLPNIEYNIRQGNSLVGLIQKPDVPSIGEYIDLEIDDKIVLLESNYPEKAEEIRELSHLPNVLNMTKIKEILVDIYKNENIPGLRNILKILINQVLGTIQKRISEIYIGYVNKKISSNSTIKYKDNLIYLKPFHWVIEFNDILDKGGFDIIIENPPYDVLSPKDREFFGTYYDGFKLLDKIKQKDVKKRLLGDQKISVAFTQYLNSFKMYNLLLKYLPEYSLLTNTLNGQKWKKSDPNSYRFFIERSNNLLQREGRLGIICPKGFIGELGSTALRKYLLSTYSEFEFREFNNRTEEELIFEDVDPNFRFVVFSYFKKENIGDPIVAYRYCNKLDEINRTYSSYEKNSLDFFLKLNGEVCILQWIRSSIEFQILEKMSKYPKMNDEMSSLLLRTARELDTTDIDKFTITPTQIALCEGSLIGHYSYNKKPLKYVLPDKFSPNQDFYKKRVVIRRILPNSVRKFYSSIIPSNVAVGGSLVYIIPEQTYDEQCYVVGLLNSLILEYRGRQLLSKMTLNQYILDILPIPRTSNEITNCISKLSKDLIEKNIHQSKRQETMNKIDSLVIRLFGLDSAESKFVVNTFRIPYEDKRQIIEFMKTPTKQMTGGSTCN